MILVTLGAIYYTKEKMSRSQQVDPDSFMVADCVELGVVAVILLTFILAKLIIRRTTSKFDIMIQARNSCISIVCMYAVF